MDPAPLEYKIRRSDRARHARIVVDADGVEVVVPRRMALRHVEPFVREKQPWIERTLRKYRTAGVAAGVEVDLRDGGIVPYLGEQLFLRVQVEPGRTRPHVARRRAPVVRAPAGMLFDPGADPATAVEPDGMLVVKVGRTAEVRDALERWYRKQARIEVEPRLDAAVARAGLSYTRLTIRAQRTRWASCSSNGTMSFNWRLLLAPPEILDYVVEHEVAHLTVMDHSQRFWRLLESRWPSYREHERWLRRHGPALRF